jgi:superfamily II DNA/RNA helicase
MIEFHRIAEVIRNWPHADVRPDAFRDPEIRRLARVLLANRHDEVTPGDLCPLLRTVLRRAACESGAPAALVVPETEPFPSRNVLRAHGLTAQVYGPGLLRVDAEPWRPAWSDGLVVDQWVYGRLPTPAAAVSGVRADPAVLRHLGYGEFATPGQAGAVRATMLLDGQLPLLANLPTGAGKSLAFQVLALVEAERGGTTVIVVPTTALALDQERRLLETGRLEAPLAFHSGLSSGIRTEFRRELRNGTKKVVITSPEAALRDLLPSLSHLAEQGGLAALVVDEAHLVSGWGAEFRPEFQLLGALQRHLRAVHPVPSRFRTVLLSATVTQSTRDDLEAVFGPIREVAAVEFRREPEFWIAHFDSPGERSRAVLEAMRHLPRPCILYTSKRDDASQLFALMRSEGGMERIALVRGGDLAADGGSSSVIAQWERGDLDVIVATSAFGLGVDNREARAVIHACVPESVDRFYQELGRAGRDGRPSLSLLLWCDADLDVARSLASERYIGDEKGWGRWKAMHARQVRHPSDPELVGLPIDRVPHWLYWRGDRNRAWNQRTLNLMQRAGILWLEVDGRPTDAVDQEVGLPRPRVVWARIRSPEAANSEIAWCNQVGAIRGALLRQAAQELERLREDLLGCRVPFCELFAKQYEHGPASVVRETGPDPVTRSRATLPMAPPVHPCPVLADPRPAFPARIRGSSPGTVVEIPEAWEANDSVTLMLELISRGFVDLAVPEGLLGHPHLLESDRRSPWGYVALRDVASRCGIEHRIAQNDFQCASRIVYLPSTYPAHLARALVGRLRRADMASFILIEPGLREAEAPFRLLLSVLEGPRVRAEHLLHRLRHGNPEPHH